jgi:1-acyl-sn-glycerol-3-phosphate acyltransferase
MTKIEYFETPILGGIVIALGGFPVRRGEADRQALKSALAILKLGGLLAVYPEGTRSKTFTLQPGHAGAALIATTADVPVLPTAIWGSENIMRRKKWGFLRRPRVDFVIGSPYHLKEAATAFATAHNLTSSGKRGRHGDLNFMSDFMMLKIAELLPPEYRGEFTPEGIVARYHARAAQKSPTKTSLA